MSRGHGGQTDFIRGNFRTPSLRPSFSVLFAPQMFGHLADRPTEEVARKKRPKLGFYVSGGKRPHLRAPAAASCSGVQTFCGGAYDVTVQHVLYYFALGHLLSRRPFLLSFLPTIRRYAYERGSERGSTSWRGDHQSNKQGE